MEPLLITRVLNRKGNANILLKYSLCSAVKLLHVHVASKIRLRELNALVLNPIANFACTATCSFYSTSIVKKHSCIFFFDNLLFFFLHFSLRTCSSPANVRTLQWNLLTLAWPLRCRGINRPGLVGLLHTRVHFMLQVLLTGCWQIKAPQKYNPDSV